MTVRTAQGFAAGVLVALLFGAVASFHIAAADGNPSTLLHISASAYDGNPLLREQHAIRDSLVLDGGYDGQYTYFAVFDPWLTRYAHATDNYVFMMDMAPYRYGRIGHVWLTRLLAGTDWPDYPRTLVLIVLGSTAVAAWVLAAIAAGAGRSPWWGLAIAAVPGYWQSTQLTLPEPLAAAVVLVGYLLWTRGVWWGAALAWAFAILTRETSLIAVVLLAGASGITTGRWTRPALTLGMALLPWLAWRLHIGLTLAPSFGDDAWFFNPGTFDWPLAGIAEAARRMHAGVYHPTAPEITRAALTFGPLLVTTAVGAWHLAWRTVRPEALVAAAYAAMAVCLSGITVWNHPGNAQRTSSELFLWLVVAALSHDRRGLWIGWLVLCAAYILGGAHDAGTIRQAFGIQ